MTKEKYALLDTDFISKTHLIRKDDKNKMIDRILEMKGYRFYCHEQIKTELGSHNAGDSSEWLNNMVSEGSVRCVSGEEILAELHAVYSDSAEAMYAGRLEELLNGNLRYKQ